MRTRIAIIVVAIVLGLFAAFAASRYLQSQRAEIVKGSELVQVLVAQQDLPAGMTAEEIVTKEYVVAREIPRQYVAEGAVSSVAALEGKVVASAVSKDEQITKARFKFPADVGLASATPKGQLAVSLPYEAARGVAGLVKPGDHVSVVASFDDIDGEDATTKIVISKAKVLAVGQALQPEQVPASETEQASSQGSLASAGQSNQITPGTITLALVPTDVEKVVYAQENGRVWLALFSPADPETPSTKGVTYKQVME